MHAPAAPAPGPPDWPGLTAQADAYRHVRLAGIFRHDRETLVKAVTERGAGFWVLTPLETDAGYTVLVNRGFVPTDRAEPESRAAGQPQGRVELTGLLRLSEPGGAFLQSNDPAAGRWFSRDVQAIAAARGLADVAPYFVDAAAGPDPAALPVGGLTVIAFANSHLVYLLTWFGLAGLSLAGLVLVLRPERPEQGPS